VHGGRFKAVYAYPAEHYAWWHRILPEADLAWGAFGENLTTAGLLETGLHIGDQLRVGTALLRVTQPRSPCYKLTIRFGRDDMVKRFAESQTSGFYFAVLEEGTLQAGDAISIVERDPAAVSVADINRLYYKQSQDPALLARAVALEALPQSWREFLSRRGV
jgi:MOSC domain-containing protein YiiM